MFLWIIIGLIWLSGLEHEANVVAFCHLSMEQEGVVKLHAGMKYKKKVPHTPTHF